MTYHGYQGIVTVTLHDGTKEKKFLNEHGEYVSIDQLENTHDPVNHPSHYTSHPSGVEVIQITEHMNFCLGNVLKYIMRAEHKGRQLEDLKKAAWYLDREIKRIERMQD